LLSLNFDFERIECGLTSHVSIIKICTKKCDISN